ncbi:phosphate-binding protein PstS [Paractinoplanes abujensis]|uniref:Phosphate-binding protein n=1 Tax=Paractinoplanes abujensis TaxID=882441 RepID=A0A7W7CNV7_9ACTN|nr:phosphate ABC transporter substrate-binding protein PstS [Actinoplanes abujensis]MBB4690545.1 phosphate transport system substrate-binding protein [Actinoplanes abujensis]GID24916.1 phosphate-binding protein PstS [Actinoplanes abujensis]
MKTRLLGLAALLLVVAACDSPSAPASAAIECGKGSISAQGSSAQANAISAWIKAYQVSCVEATIEYTSVGSGDGRRAFFAGTGHFAGSDSPTPDDEQTQARVRCRGPLVHLPMVAGPIALAYTVAGVNDLRLSPATIARIFTGRATRWNDRAVRADNPGVTLPETPIRTVHRAGSSGTTENFTRFLASTARADWGSKVSPTWPARGGIAAESSNDLVSAIERTDGAIGYVEASYARFHNLPTAEVGNAAGQFVAVGDAAAARTVGGARVVGTEGLRLEFDYRVSDPRAYPLVLVTYEIVCRTGTPDLVKSFLSYASSAAGQDTAAATGYAPLPDELRERVAQTVAAL